MNKKTKESIIGIAKKHGFTLDSNIEVVETGLDFQVVFHTDDKNQEWVLRFPRRDDVYEKIRHEKNILDYLATKELPFKAPLFAVFSSDLIAYKLVQGKIGLSVNNDMSLDWAFDINNIPKKYTKSFASALVSLHQLAKDECKVNGLIIHKPSELRKVIREKIELVKNKFLISNKKLMEWDEWLNDSSLWPKETGFIHGDLYLGHILLNNYNEVIGIIDWTEAKISDISYDFLSHYKSFGIEGLRELIKEYKELGGYYWDNMEKHIIKMSTIEPLIIAEFAISSNLSEYIELAKQLLLTD